MSGERSTDPGPNAHPPDQSSLPGPGLFISSTGLSLASHNIDRTICHLLQDLEDEKAVEVAQRIIVLGLEGLCHLRSINAASGEIRLCDSESLNVLTNRSAFQIASNPCN